ncbi:MAG: hypothetical protein ACD_62C00421G0002 [uncultured bacterium]|nr:MAG: hypothetical protein ACD_62C00421G0002 [uncultured bacterium]HLD44340.1 type I-E CRISPR-associated protein Cse1/CasA [bacterium]
MNLLDEAWIPVRRSNGKLDWISPYQMTESDLVALAANRPDFNGALIQFLIGLVQTTTPMDSQAEWERWNTNPPNIEELKKWFAPVREAFVFDGDGSRFMQDFDLRTQETKDDEFNEIGALLIESPGDQTLKLNKDHFVKRNRTSALCPHCAITALFTLQTNAPSGGNGHFTSIRGGGPLTTLIMPGQSSSLWQIVWLNVREKTQFNTSHGNADLKKPQYIFPWLGDMKTIQPDGGKTTPIQVHPAHVFWGMPRRIRLDQENVTKGACDICGRLSDKLMTRYLTIARGFDYKGGWRHPLSPYREEKQGEMFAVHPQPDGIGYKHWLSWILGQQTDKKKILPASIVSHVIDSHRLASHYRLWVFGYDMDNMKARCWYESILPLYGVTDKNIDGRRLIQREIAKWLESAEYVVYLLRSNVKSAWFGDDAEVRGNLSFIDVFFWSQTEPDFYHQLIALIEQARDEENDPTLLPMREAWREVLIKVALHLFDADLVGVAPIQQQNPRRMAEAYKRLRMSLYGDKLKALLGLPVEKKEKKIKKSAKNVAA